MWKAHFLENDRGLNQSGPYGIVAYSSGQEVNRAMDDRPHIIGGKHLKIELLAKVISQQFPSSLDLFQKTLPKRHCATNSPNMERPFTRNWKMTGSLINWDLMELFHIPQTKK
ncbi:hypothetical protein Ddc_16629 [Ditylenchus destructor]|nr:hypothetical protein Ddc_16629 [Ditylenchus destructor]